MDCQEEDISTNTAEPLLTERFDGALAYASAAHRDQVRKGSRIPYVSHLLGVASIAIENGADEDQAIAALLHDAVEDQGGLVQLREIRARFGERVAAMVLDCTDDLENSKSSALTPTERKREWRERKESYIAGLSQKPQASLEVSVADKTHNAAAINTDLRASGEEVWSRFTGEKHGTLWYYAELADAFSRLIPGCATERFCREVAEMKALSL